MCDGGDGGGTFFTAPLCVAVGDPCGGAWPQNKVVRWLTFRHDGRSVWQSLCFLGKYAATLLLVYCFGDNVPAAVRLPDGEGEERKEVRERGGQESHWVSRRGGHCPTNPAPLLSGTLSLTLCRIVFDATSTQRGSGCHHRHECDWKGTHLLLRSEGAIRVAQWRAHNPLAESSHDTGHWPRSVCVVEDTAAESLFLSGGRTPVFTLFPTQADGCAMTPQRGSCFHDGGATSAGLRIGNMNGECSKKGSVMALLCCANFGDFS
ncbi:hypothetical protein TcCL_Unassigned01677 [Trypanosoma cruzi]|nr:hypothetical protein TcCL_Unassigned01677 [Trypanosoma cruzi]